MAKRTRRNHTAAFKAKVALAAIKGEKTLADPRIKSGESQQFDVHANQITTWKAQLLDGPPASSAPKARPPQLRWTSRPSSRSAAVWQQ